MSGGAPLGILLSDARADAEVRTADENVAIEKPDLDDPRPWLVDYLRTTILEHGGFPGLPANSPIAAQLTVGLEPF
jgi:hypothetical protein